MGAYKNSLPEDIDITDPRDTGEYGEPQDAPEPDEDELKLGWAMHNIDGDIAHLEELVKRHQIPLDDADKIRAYADRLTDVAVKVEVPF